MVPTKMLKCAAAAFLLFLGSAKAATDVEVGGESDILDLHGSGTTNPSKYYWQLMDLMTERTSTPLKTSYRAVGSSTGQHEFVGDDSFSSYADFGSGDVPLSEED